MKHCNNLIAKPHRLLSMKRYTNHLKCHLSRRLVPVLGLNLALLPDNCNA